MSAAIATLLAIVALLVAASLALLVRLGAAIVGDSATAENSAWHYLYKLADQIDREHERRMRQQSYDLRKAFCRYLGGVIDDYRHGMKRKRLRK